ncbi:MAG: hypothetical protein LLG13_07380 [Bacteroidales bacterium]|nr:hypothetical protein [Bacteroidales bacterium]
MKKLLIIAVMIFSGTVILYSQGELNEQQKVFFRNERSLAILLNSDGFGLNFRGAQRSDYLNKHLFEIDLGIFKHPKEYRYSSSYISGGSFVFGKLNTTLFLRGGIGHQHEIFKKADLGGIAIRYFYSAGPVIALYKPIYYKVLYPVSSTMYGIKVEKFTTAITVPEEIYSKASFSKGLNEIKVMPGLYAKGGFNFEYSKQDKVIHAVEIGCQINAFPKEIPIMANTNNKALFFSLFVSYRFGVIIDPLDPESNKFSNFFRRKKNN